MPPWYGLAGAAAEDGAFSRIVSTVPAMVRLLACLVLLGAAGCATTQAYERERLADPTMAVDEDPDRAALAGHVRAVREGAIGSDGAGGGGCGCN